MTTDKEQGFKDSLDDIKRIVQSKFDESREFIKTLEFNQINSGEWFTQLLGKVIQTSERNARAAYFIEKYPGLAPDEIADILTKTVEKYAAVAGAIAGAGATAGEISALASYGLSSALLPTVILAEMVYVSRIQLRLIYDLSVVYNLPLDLEDPEDIFLIFGYALGIAPADLVGKGLQIATKSLTKRGVKQVFTKGTLKATQNIAAKIGVKVLQKTILKYAIPITSIGIGGLYNFTTTKSLGSIAKSHFKERGKLTDELQALISNQYKYDIVFPAAIMYMAKVDGVLKDKENDLYKALLLRISVNEHEKEDFQKLISDESNLLDAISKIENHDIQKALLETLILMAVIDGELVDQERAFLRSVSNRFNILLDFQEIESRAKEYQSIIRPTFFAATAEKAGQLTAKTVEITGSTALEVIDAASKTFKSGRRLFDKTFNRNVGKEIKPESVVQPPIDKPNPGTTKWPPPSKSIN